MESGTLLHIALLRKIANLAPIPQHREKYSEFKKRQSLRSCAHYESEKCIEAIAPLTQKRYSKNINRGATQRERHRKIKEKVHENITISAWSIKSIEHPENVEENQEHRYKQYAKKENKSKLKFRKHRNMSQVNPLQKAKAPLFNDLQNFIPDYVFKRKNQPARPLWKPKQFPMKQTSINYEGQVTEPCQKQVIRCETEEKVKLPSYQAFIREMKIQARRNKQQH